MGCTFYYDFSSVIIVVVVDGVVVVVVGMVGMCVLIGVAGAAFDFYASILLHIVVCTDRQSIFYAFLSLHFITTATIV